MARSGEVYEGKWLRMKRSEMLEHIREELKEFVEYYNIASEKAKSHVVRARADTILSMLEGFGIKPPKALFKVDPDAGCLCTMRENCKGCGGWLNEWEKEI